MSMTHSCIMRSARRSVHGRN